MHRRIFLKFGAGLPPAVAGMKHPGAEPWKRMVIEVVMEV